VQNTFFSYFNNGMIPALSKSHHEVMLTGINDENDSMDYIKTLANAQKNPTE
jgi:hypothetical protein